MNSPNDPRYPRSTSELEMDERDSKGGRKDREIELGMRLIERRMEHDKHNEHSNVFTEGNNFIYKKQYVSLSYNCLFYRVEKEGS